MARDAEGDVGGSILAGMTRLLRYGLLAFALSGCAVVVADEPEHPPGPPVAAPRSLNIPKGHYPPPGSCRIWFPDRPAGQQPPPGRCDELHYQVPPGAYLIRG